jgi:hypothetical protein
MNFCDAVVINAHGFAQRILSDFEPAIEVSPEQGWKIKLEG